MRIVCDFDGVICNDTIDRIYDNLFDSDSRIEIENKYKQGAISFETCIRTITSSIPKHTVGPDMIATTIIDPAFSRLVDLSSDHNIELIILSSNDRHLINDILAYHFPDMQIPMIIANQFNFYSDQTCIYEKQFHPEYIAWLSKSEHLPLVYIGDGISDIGVVLAQSFDQIYATSYLADYCACRDIGHTYFNHLGEVAGAIEDHLVSHIIEQEPDSKYLLSPGVVRAYPEATIATTRHFTNMHRSDAFHDLFKLWGDHLLRVLCTTRDSYTPMIVTGSGTSAMDTVIESLVEQSRQTNKILFVANGMFGDRWLEIATHYASYIPYAAIDAIVYPWGQPFNQEEIINKAIAIHASHVVFVHHDTSVGIHNNLSLVNALASSHIHAVVDCVSSFAFYPIDLTEYPMGIFVTNPNKGLGSYQGIGIILVANHLEIAPSRKYLDLHKHVTLAKKYEPTNTPSILALHASYEILRHLSFEKITHRYTIAHALHKKCIQQLRQLSVQLLLPEKDMFCAILTIQIDNADNFISYCSRTCIVYPGKGPLQNKYVQVSLYGKDGHEKAMQHFITCLKSYLETVTHEYHCTSAI